MKLCTNKEGECYPICDFCKHYHFNGDEQGRYTGNGICELKNENTHPDDGCDDFYCSEAK